MEGRYTNMCTNVLKVTLDEKLRLIFFGTLNVSETL